jgi:hypothetical protein
MGRACNTNGENYIGGNVRRKGATRKPWIGWIILRWILDRYNEDWNDLAQERNQATALVDTLKNLRDP